MEDLSHWIHWYLFHRVCVLRLLFNEKALHWLFWYFPPVWFKLIVRLLLIEKDLLHLLPQCIDMIYPQYNSSIKYILREHFSVKALSQLLLSYVFFLVCAFIDNCPLQNVQNNDTLAIAVLNPTYDNQYTSRESHRK